jgi:3-isopropylmalate/(R)-2-methylmalate dehydratase small subunit
MQPLTVHRGLVAPLDRANVDTDAIIPKQFLKSIKRTGFGPNLFDEWRYLDQGEPGHGQQPPPLNPAFVLNQPRFRARPSCWRARTSAAARREHAPWAHEDYGFRVVMAPLVRRHLLQQLLQERPAAGPAHRPKSIDALFHDVNASPGSN